MTKGEKRDLSKLIKSEHNLNELKHRLTWQTTKGKKYIDREKGRIKVKPTASLGSELVKVQVFNYKYQGDFIISIIQEPILTINTTDIERLRIGEKVYLSEYIEHFENEFGKPELRNLKWYVNSREIKNPWVVEDFKAGTNIEIKVSYSKRDIKKSQTFTAQVVQNEKIEITHNPKTPIKVNHQSLISYSYTNEMGETDNNVDVKWSTSNERILTVDNNGRITAVGPGTAKVTLILRNNPEVSKSFEVKVIQNEKIEITKKPESPIYINDQSQISYLFTNELGKTDDNVDVKWSTSNEGILTIDNDGRITAVGPGTAIVTLNLQNNPSVSKSFEVKVIQTKKIVITNKPDNPINVGEQFIPLYFIFTNESGETDNNVDLKWSTTNSEILTVDNNGRITPVGAGTVTITVQLQNNPEVKDSINITVNLPKRTIRKVADQGGKIDGPNQVNAYDGDQLTLTATPDNGYEFNNWVITGNCNIASVNNPEGTIEVDGDCTITATFNAGGCPDTSSHDGNAIQDLIVDNCTIINPLELDTNGITVVVKNEFIEKKDEIIGKKGWIDYNGQRTYYKIVSEDMLRDLIYHRKFDELTEVNTTFVKDMRSLFFQVESFNHDISSWDVSNVVNMENMFTFAKLFNKDISSWDVSNVTTMKAMFTATVKFDKDISSWDVSNVTDLTGTFQGAYTFNQDISGWDVSNVTTMYRTFAHASSFNQDISGWDVSNVTTMYEMFVTTRDFNNGGKPLNWDEKLGNIETMNKMFYSAKSFNQDISGWNVSNVRRMEFMFGYTKSFNQDISGWDVGNVRTMREMFKDANSFNQDISEWNVNKVRNCSKFADNSPLLLSESNLPNFINCRN